MKKLSTRKLLQITLIAVAGLWVFCIVMVISLKVAKDRQPVTMPTIAATSVSMPTSYPLATTTQPQSSAQKPDNNVTTVPGVSQSQKETKQEETTTKKSDTPKSKAEIISAYISAVNKLKSTKNFSLLKTRNLEINVDKMQPSLIQNIASGIIEKNRATAPEEYRFQDGVDTVDASRAATPNQTIEPAGKIAYLDETYVTGATAKKNSDGSMSITIKLGRSSQSLQEPAGGYSTSTGVLDLQSIGLPSNANVTELNVVYNNSTIEAQLDKEGKITRMKHVVNVETANAKGRYLAVDVNVVIHGSATVNYVITY